jgi:hypothetical protein
LYRFSRDLESGEVNNSNCIVGRIKEQLDAVTKEYDSARSELDNIVECFITDIKNNLTYYLINNIKREIRKNPKSFEGAAEERLNTLLKELTPSLQTRIEEIVANLRNFKGWYDEDTVYVDTNSKAWKWVKSAEEPANKILKKFSLGAIDMKNWNWLSIETNELITTRFSEIKKNFIDKRKQYNYLEARFREEQKIQGILGRLDSV